MKKLIPLFLFVLFSFTCFSQFDSDTAILQSITTHKDYWKVFYADSIPILINNKKYTGIDTSQFIENGEKLLVLETFKDGLKVEVKIFYENGNPYCFYQFKNGKRDGVSKRWYKSGKIMFDNKMKEGKNVGIQISFYENEFPEYISDENSGISIGFYANGRTKGLTKHFVDSVKCGNKLGYEETRWYPDGVLMLKQINNCGRQSYKMYYNDSTLYTDETIIDMALFHVGKYTKWYRNGEKMIEGQYEDGNTQSEANIKTGVWKYWNEKGKLEKEEFYENNELIKTKEYGKPKKLKESEK